MEASLGAPDVVIYNASFRTRGPLVELEPAEVEKAIAVSAFGGFLVAQQAARRMLPQRRGAIFFTGASASVKGYAQSAPFAMGKFALRGLAQSMARELSPRGIHVAHFVIDGGIRGERRAPAADKPDALLDPDAIAQSYLHVLQQPRSAWTFELEVRPWVESF
jgi:NAD(P)-dependent dehydrogenase (short-subunit alcohol dehydrogenase family)